MAISSGNLELIRIMWERLPEEELKTRLALLEVAADFHREDVLGWLFRDATIFEKELLTVFTLERRLADAILEISEWGFRPWWDETRKAAAKWPATARIEFFDPPEGFSVDGGWWEDEDGVLSAILMPAEADCGRWTGAKTKSMIGEREARSVVLPSCLKVLGGDAFPGCLKLHSVRIPSGLTMIEDGRWCGHQVEGAFCCCPSLGTVTIPEACTRIGQFAFHRCQALATLMILEGCRYIGDSAFSRCALLTTATIPRGC